MVLKFKPLDYSQREKEIALQLMRHKRIKLLGITLFILTFVYLIFFGVYAFSQSRCSTPWFSLNLQTPPETAVTQLRHGVSTSTTQR